MHSLRSSKILSRKFLSRKRSKICTQDLSKAGKLMSAGLQVKVGTPFFRSVPWDEPPENVGKLSYPPKNRVKKQGRCNEVGETVLYVSTDKAAIFAEQKDLKVGKTYAISEWRTKTELQTALVGFPPNHPLLAKYNLPSDCDSALLWNSIFNRCFRKKGSGLYPQTVAIYKNFINSGITKDGNPRPTAVIYPSVDHPNPNTLAINLACNDIVADNCFEFVHASFVKITSISNTGVEFTTLEEGDDIDANGHIQWKRIFTLPVDIAKDITKVVIPSAKAHPIGVSASGEETPLEYHLSSVKY